MLDDSHPLTLEIESLRNAVSRFQDEAHSASVKLQRFSFDTSTIQDRLIHLEHENEALRNEVFILRANPHPDTLPESHPAVQQSAQLTLALRRLSDKLSVSEEALLSRTTELANATSEATRCRATMEGAYALAAQMRGREEEAKIRERELLMEIRAAREEARMSDMVVKEYADLVRSLDAKNPSTSAAQNSTLTDGLSEGKLGLKQLFNDFTSEIESLNAQVTQLQGQVADAESRIEAERKAGEAERLLLVQTRHELDELRLEDKSAAKMVSRYMKFSQTSTNTLQTSLNTLKTRYSATIETLTSQISALARQLHAADATSERLRMTLDELGRDIIREAFGRRREIALRLRLVTREQVLNDGLEKLVRRVAEAVDRNTEPALVLQRILDDARGLLASINGEEFLDGSEGSLARVIAAESAVRGLAEELKIEMTRRLQVETKISGHALNGHAQQYHRATPSQDQEKGLPEVPLASSTPSPLPASSTPSSPSIAHETGSETGSPLLSSIASAPPAQDGSPESELAHPIPSTQSRSLSVHDEAESTASISSSPSAPLSVLDESFLPMTEASPVIPLTIPLATLSPASQDELSIEASPSVLDVLPANLEASSISSVPTEGVMAETSPSEEPQNTGGDLEPLEVTEVSQFTTSDAILVSTVEDKPLQAPLLQLGDVHVAPVLESTSNIPEGEYQSIAIAPPSNSSLDTGATPQSIVPSTSNGPTTLPDIAVTNTPSGDYNPHAAPVVPHLLTSSTLTPDTASSPSVDLQNDKLAPDIPHPLLAELTHLTQRYADIQRSFRECHLSLEELKKSTSSSSIPSHVQLAIDRLDDYTEDASVELEIRIADEALAVQGYETMLSVPGAISTPSSQSRFSHNRTTSEAPAPTLGELESQIQVFQSNSEKARQGFERKLADIQHDIARMKQVVHDPSASLVTELEPDPPIPSAQNTNPSGWTSWTTRIIPGSPSRPSSPAPVSPPTFGNVMTTPRLRHASSIQRMKQQSQSPGSSRDDPFAGLGLKVAMPGSSYRAVSLSHGHGPGSSPGARNRTVSLLGLGGMARSASGSFGSPGKGVAPPLSRSSSHSESLQDSDEEIE
ncbi:hypothetical protein VNI00_014162 [Paramarasmius palmivorus]|uniref:Uncharacterized protein n=1 Tax=Paramarasmius palmivorus TaxID=297713 RepID=A0AAW0BU67_9AGAR